MHEKAPSGTAIPTERKQTMTVTFYPWEAGKSMIYGKKDPQDIAPVAYCIHCGGEIYPGEEPWEPDGEDGFVHRECVKDYMFEHYALTLGRYVEV